MMTDSGFLSDLDLRPLRLADSQGFGTVGLALGQGNPPLEVAITECEGKPAQGSLRAAWAARVGGRATPVLLVTLYGSRAAICGPAGDKPPTYLDLEPGQVERLCRTALEEPDRHAALRFLSSALDALETKTPGLRNEGFLSTHELQEGLRDRADYSEATGKGRQCLTQRGEHLLRSLGFDIERLSGPASVLKAGPRHSAVGVLLNRSESPDASHERFYGNSPVSYAMSKADETDLPYVIVVSGPSIRIYPVRPGTGVGRRGRTETFAELHLELLRDEDASMLWYIFSADALRSDGYLADLLEASGRFATGLGNRLRERVYERVVPALAKALARARGIPHPTQQELDDTYQMALTVLFRLVFIAYAEDRDLLPYRSNDLYRARSLKRKAQDLQQVEKEGGRYDAKSYSHWHETFELFQAVDRGNTEWGIPAYNGGLFSSDRSASSLAAELAGLELTNAEYGPALKDLLLDQTADDILGPVDFRSLGVRNFGTIYEGLLESELSIAETDLDVNERGDYIPTDVSQPLVHKGEIYLHHRSGSRKSTGSYFTKPFAVEHLLRYSLEPALEDHEKRLNSLPEEEAGAAFFDFRVADIAMGSGHFLVAAVDHIERRLSSYLAERPFPWSRRSSTACGVGRRRT